jgi:gluconokinase
MLKVPREILKSRVVNRKDHFAKEDLIDSQLDTLELPEDEPNIIVIDGTLPIEQVVNEIIHRLNFILSDRE